MATERNLANVPNVVERVRQRTGAVLFSRGCIHSLNNLEQKTSVSENVMFEARTGSSDLLSFCAVLT